MTEQDKINGGETDEEVVGDVQTDGTVTENKEGAESASGEETVQAGEKTDEADGGNASDETLQAELEKAQAAAEDYKRKWYAVAAEYDNYRKRTKEAVSQSYQDGKAEAILKLLPVADTFGYAYDGASDEKTKAGIDKIVKNFNAILLSMGVEEVAVNCGDSFDESVMEAVINIPCEEGESAGVVKNVLKKGYRRDGKVIRFAQVSVTV